MLSLRKPSLLSAHLPHIVLVLLVHCCIPGTSLQNILVTGAGGRTGEWVVQELLDNPQFTPTAVVRNERSANRLRKRLPPFGLHQIVVCDIMQMVQPSNARSKAATVPPLDEWILGRRQWLATTEEDAVVSGPEQSLVLWPSSVMSSLPPPIPQPVPFPRAPWLRCPPPRCHKLQVLVRNVRYNRFG